MLRLGVRELGWGTTEEVARELSAFADACLDVAVAFCDAALTRELGPPRADSGAPTRFVVMAMGKLGGDELNFSSDIDVCYFYSTDAGAAGPAGASTLHHYYAELSRRVTAAIEEPTADGMIFRVDLRLRPEGRSGPICNSLPAAERYYETFGRTWERQAWLRARPAAGDRALGDELLALLDPFIYPRHVDPRMVEEVRGLRALFRDPADASGALGDTGFDVKLGSGGIRDVEMVVQALQLLHAGKRPDLRERNTPRAVPRLLVAGLLGAREARDAARRLSILAAARAPGAGGDRRAAPPPAGRRRGAGRLRARPRVRRPGGVRRRGRRHARRRRGDRRDAGRARGRGAPRRARACSIRCAGATSSSGGSPPPASATPRWRPTRWSWSARACRWRSSRRRSPRPIPIARSAHFRDLALRGSVGLMALLRDHPRLVRMLGTLFGTSDRLAELLVRHPEMWEPFVDGLGASVRSRRELGERLAARLDGEVRWGAGGAGGDRAARDPELPGRGDPAHRPARRGGEPGRRRGLPAAQRFAEVCFSAGITAALPALEARLGKPRTALTVLGLGSLGAREMRYGSDLDLVFLYGADGESDTGVDHREWFARASQRFIAAMEAMLEEGRLYQVDTRLRPSGEQGLLVTSWASFERYHREEAAAWERVALLRARIVWSDEPTAARAGRDRALATLAFDLPFDDARFRADLRRVRGRVERERGKVPAGSRHLHFDPGGIMDVELLVALGQLRQAADAEVRTTSTAAALERLVALGWPATLRDDYAVLRRTALRLRLLLDRPQAVVSPARSAGAGPEPGDDGPGPGRRARRADDACSSGRSQKLLS